MKHYVTITGKTISGRLYLRGGAKMYTRSLEDAAAFDTLRDARKAAADLEFLLCLLPSRTYTVGTMSRQGGAS